MRFEAIDLNFGIQIVASGSAAASIFGRPTSLVPNKIWRWRLVKSTLSKSTRPMRPTPAAARYKPSGAPSPPVPMHRTLRVLQLELTFHADFRHDQMAAIAQDFFLRKRNRRLRWRRFGRVEISVLVAIVKTPEFTLPRRRRSTARCLRCRRRAPASDPSAGSGCLHRLRRRSQNSAAFHRPSTRCFLRSANCDPSARLRASPTVPACSSNAFLLTRVRAQRRRDHYFHCHSCSSSANQVCDQIASDSQTLTERTRIQSPRSRNAERSSRSRHEFMSLRLAGLHADDDVAVPRPGVLAIELARAGRCIRVRMIPSDQVELLARCALFSASRTSSGVTSKPIARRIIAPVLQRHQTPALRVASSSPITNEMAPQHSCGYVFDSVRANAASQRFAIFRTTPRSLLAPESFAQIFFARVRKYRDDDGSLVRAATSARLPSKPTTPRPN